MLNFSSNWNLSGRERRSFVALAETIPVSTLALERLIELLSKGTHHDNEVNEAIGNFSITGNLLFRLSSRR